MTPTCPVNAQSKWSYIMFSVIELASCFFQGHKCVSENVIVDGGSTLGPSLQKIIIFYGILKILIAFFINLHNSLDP